MIFVAVYITVWIWGRAFKGLMQVFTESWGRIIHRGFDRMIVLPFPSARKEGWASPLTEAMEKCSNF